MPLHASSTMYSSSGGQNCTYYTASGIITPIGGHPVCRVLSQPVHRTATYRCDDTRCCI